MKKILALCLTLIMVVSSLAMVVSAAEMITITVPAQTLVDGKFYDDSTGTNAALTEAPAGWTLGGTYSFGANGIRATNYKGFTLYKTEAFDTKGANYEFSVTMATFTGNNYIHLGAQTTADAIKDAVADTGYTLNVGVPANNNTTGTYYLYKNGTAIEGLTLTDTNTSYGYQTNRTFKFKVTSTGMTITGPFVGSPLTIEDAEPITSGYVGIKLRDNNGTKGNLKAMSLSTEEYSYEIEKPAEAVTGAKATYEKPGKTYMNYDLRGASALPSGVTATGTYTLGASGLTWSGNPDVTTSFGAAEVDADVTDFTVEARYNAKYNGSPVFNFLGYSLSKTGNYNTEKTYTLKKGTDTLGTGTLGTDFNAGSVLVKVAFSGKNITVNIAGTDVITAIDENVSKSGNVSIRTGWISNPVVGGVKIASLPTNVTKTNFLVDRTFGKYDTIAGLSADGYSISGTFNTTTANGIDGTAGGGIGNFQYDGATFEGGYTAELKFFCTDNVPSMYFNYVDADNYYKLNTNQSKKFSLTKSVKGEDDETATVTTLIDGATNTVGSLLSAESAYNIKLTILDDESMDIEITCIGLATTCKFDKVNDPTPITAGKIKYASGWSRANYGNYVKSLKVYPTPAADEDVAEYEGSFQIGAEAATEIANGNVMFRFPVAMVGQNPDFIAVLYKDYEMVDIKVFNVYEANEGLYPLFDLTQNTADNVSIAVYTWNTLEGMVPVLDTVVLD